MNTVVCRTEPQISISLGPVGPFALVYVAAFYGTGRFFGALGCWLVFRFGLSQRLGISVSEREMREEVEHRFGLIGGSVYLVFWLLTLCGIGPIR